MGEMNMNIQIFGFKNCFDTKKAERYFKERRIKYQFIDLKEKSLSKRELESVRVSVKDINKLTWKGRIIMKKELKSSQYLEMFFLVLTKGIIQ